MISDEIFGGTAPELSNDATSFILGANVSF